MPDGTWPDLVHARCIRNCDVSMYIATHIVI